MSIMYGKRRAVLETKADRWGRWRVSICGSDGQGGLYFPLGYWYSLEGEFYADLLPYDQWYSNRVSSNDYKTVRFPTKKALRDYVMEYWKNRE